ncbi:MAG: hypothetical protein ACTHMD_03295 [Flavisolibacter sp.]
MQILKKYFCYIVCMVSIGCLFGCGFFDIEKAESRKVIGNIYVINLNIPEDAGYYIVFRKHPNADRYLLKDYEYVDYLKGNDSILLVKTKINSINKYHLIEHYKGDKVVRVQDLSALDFLNYEHFLKEKYTFNSNFP